MSGYAGHGHTLVIEWDYPLGYCVNNEEFKRFLEHLAERRLITHDASGQELTIDGWERVRELERTPTLSSQAFVAMDFSPGAFSIFEKGLAKGIEDAGWRAFRIDREEHANRIDDEIIVQIDQSRFMVADFTGQKHGVYFEAGYALSARIPVIWTCRKAEIEKLHFDVRQFNMIDWESHEELARRLRFRILALVGEGPERVSEAPAEVAEALEG